MVGVVLGLHRLFFMDFSTQLSSQLGATSRATPLYLCFEN